MAAEEFVPASQLVVHDVSDEHCAASLGGLLILIIKGDPRPSIFEQQRRWHRKLDEASPHGAAFLGVLQADTPPPTEEARVVINRVFREFGKVVKGGVMVIEGDGFVAASFRSVLSMIVLALRLPYPLKVQRSIGEGCLLILPAIGKEARPSVQEVLVAAEWLKKEYRAGTLRVSPADSRPPRASR